MSQLPALASIASIEKQLCIIAARLKVLTQYAALSISDRDIYILLEDVYEGIKALKRDDLDGFCNLKADFMVLAYYEREKLNPDFDNSMFSLSQKFEALEVAISDRLSFDAAVHQLERVGASHE